MRINNGDKAFLVEHDIGESCSFKAENGQEVPWFEVFARAEERVAVAGTV
jgi:hypothetical protein